MRNKRTNNRQPQSKWLTNNLSDFVPTKVGDVVDEMALGFKTKSAQYDIGKQNYIKGRDTLDLLNANTGNKNHLKRAQEAYKEAYGIAENEGDFENKLYDAGNLTSKLGKEYNFKGMQAGYLQEQEDNKWLEEAEIPDNYKSNIKRNSLELNTEDNKDAEGNFIYKNYKPINRRNYIEAFETIDKQIKGWVKDGLFSKDAKTGKLKVEGDLSAYGYGVLKKGTSISREELHNFAFNYMSGNQDLNNSIDTEAEVALENANFALKDNGRFLSVEDVVELAQQNSLYPKGSEAYKKEINELTEYIKSSLEKRKNIKGNKKFDINSELQKIGTHIVSQKLRNKYANMIVDKHDGVDETIEKFKLAKEEEAKKGSGSTSIAEDAYTYIDPLMYTSDSVTAEEQYNTNKQEVISSMNDIKSLDEQIIQLQEEEKANPGSTGDKIDRLKAQKEEKGKYLDEITKAHTKPAEEIYDLITEEEDPTLEEAIKISYEDYKKDYKIRNVVKGGIKDINHRLTFGLSEGYSGNSEEGIKSFEEFSLEFKEAIQETVNETVSDNVLTSFSHKVFDKIKDNIDKIKGMEPATYNSEFPIFSISAKGTTTKQQQKLTGFKQANEGLRQIVLFDANMKTSSGKFVQDIMTNSGVKSDDFNVNISPTPYKGSLTAVISYPEKDKDKLTGKIISELVILDNQNTNTDTVYTLYNQVMTDFTEDLVLNFNDLDKTKKKMLKDAVNIKNITDGTYKRFNENRYRTKEEGEVTEFQMGNDDYLFTTYKLGSNNKNKMLIERAKGYGYVMENGVKTDRTEVGRVVYGHTKEDYTNEGTLRIKSNGQPVSPSWILVNDNKMETPFYINEKDEVIFPNGFTPYDAGSPPDVLNTITQEQSIRRGTLDKLAFDKDILHPNHEGYIKDFTLPVINGTNNILEKERRLSEDKELFSKEKGYQPLSQFFGAENISTKVNEPFLSLNNSGQNRLNLLIRDTKRLTKSPIVITGGHSSIYNEVEGRKDDSYHNTGLALDILNNPAGRMLINLINKDREKYGIKNIISNYKDKGHIHISFDKQYQNDNYKEVTKNYKN